MAACSCCAVACAGAVPSHSPNSVFIDSTIGMASRMKTGVPEAKNSARRLTTMPHEPDVRWCIMVNIIAPMAMVSATMKPNSHA